MKLREPFFSPLDLITLYGTVNWEMFAEAKLTLNKQVV